MRTPVSSRLAARLVASLIAALTTVSLLGFTVQAHAAPGLAGHVYVLNNPAGANSISVYNRGADGSLTYDHTSGIGGLGTGDPLGSQGSLTLAGQRLFAVDGGSDQVSVVDTKDGALTLDGVYSSGGALPVSVTYRNGFLYVVNSGDASTPANVAGFTVTAGGALTPIAGADIALSAAEPGPAQVAISPDGAILAVTEKATNVVDTFRVSADGSLSDRVSAPSTGQTPFGFSFNPEQPRELVVADAAGGATGASAVTSYDAGALGAVATAIVADHQTAACWLIITDNGKYAYTTNAGSGTISGYRLGQNGGLTLLNAGGLTATTGAASHPLEMALSPNSHDLYALDAGSHTLSAFVVRRDGSLAPIALADLNLPAGAVGLAAD